MSSYITRKNPWYAFGLAVVQLGLAIWCFYRGELLWGAFMMWACGANTVYSLHPDAAPDFP